jgi:hypothetical protein
MNGVVRLDLLTRGQRDRLERELARIPSALDGRARYGIDTPTVPAWQVARNFAIGNAKGETA